MLRNFTYLIINIYFFTLQICNADLLSNVVCLIQRANEGAKDVSLDDLTKQNDLIMLESKHILNLILKKYMCLLCNNLSLISFYIVLVKQLEEELAMHKRNGVKVPQEFDVSRNFQLLNFGFNYDYFIGEFTTTSTTPPLQYIDFFNRFTTFIAFLQ